jgi:hypothetical protein
VDWASGPPDLNGQPSYNDVHAEYLDANRQWQAVIPVHQPFKIQADRDRSSIYWRKDQAGADFSYYGEIWQYDDGYIYLRSESFPYFDAFDPKGSWDARIDKFRLFSSSSNNSSDNRPYLKGRILSPRHVSPEWSEKHFIDTFACYSFDAFLSGQCRSYQSNVEDTAISQELWYGFNPYFDGLAPGDTQDPNYQNFDQVIVMNQVMNGGQSRERFFLAAKREANGNPVYYGIVRWDNSIPDPSHPGQWMVNYRTAALGQKTDQVVDFSGMQIRAEKDTYRRLAGVRLLHSDPSFYPDSSQNAECPVGMSASGSLHLGANSGDNPSSIYDLNGFQTSGGGWVGVCTAPNRMLFTLPEGCPSANARGSFFVGSAYVPRSISDPTIVQVSNSWVVFCSQDAADWRTYFSVVAPGVGCNPTEVNVGSFVGYKDCYDAYGRRCDPNQVKWMALCSQ